MVTAITKQRENVEKEKGKDNVRQKEVRRDEWRKRKEKTEKEMEGYRYSQLAISQGKGKEWKEKKVKHQH